MAKTEIRASNGTNDVAVRASAAFSSLRTVDAVHDEIHSGDHYFVVYSVANLGGMTSPDDTITLSWTTPNTTKWGNFTFTVQGTAGWRVRMIENSTTGGTTGATGRLPILNSNRNSTGASGMISDGDSGVAGNVGYDASLALGGTTLIDEYIPGGGGPFASAAQTGGRDEIILKQNTNYQVSVYGTDTDPGTIHMAWYEHTDDA